ncbi:MAG: pacearchaeosortase [Nanoarchaeota archaeon]|nr:pacearchaeosortase [Nanoarchaeota archaeon]
MQKVTNLVVRLIVLLGVLFAMPVWYAIVMPITLVASFFMVKMIMPVVLLDNSLQLGNLTLHFIPACAAVPAYILLVLLIGLTSDISWKRRLQMGGLGFLLIFIANLLRIGILIGILVLFGKNLFSAVHLVFWHGVASVYVAVVWMLLVKWFKVKSIPIISDFQMLRRWLKR